MRSQTLKRKSWAIALIAIFIVAAFQVGNQHRLYMHDDEELSYRSTNGDLAYTLNHQITLKDNQAPFWFVTFWAWRTLIGDAETTSRFLGVLTMLPALAILYRVARRGMRDQLFAGIGISLLIGNGLFFQYALDIRPYPMVMLVSAFSTWMLQRWLDAPTRSRALYYGVSIALMLYVHYLLALLVLAHVIYVVLAWRLTRQLISQGIAAGVFGLLLFAPWFPVFVNQVMGLKSVETQSGDARGALGIGVSTFTTSADSILTLLNMTTNGMIALYGVILLVGVLLLRRSRGFWLLLAWGILALTLYFLANTVFALYAPRFVSYITLPIACATAMTFFAVVRRLKLPDFTVIGLSGVFIALHLVTFPAQIPDRITHRDIFGGISAHAQPDDMVLMLNANEQNGFVQYQYRTWLTPQLLANVTTDTEAAFTARRVWLVTGDLFDADYAAFFNAFEPSHPVQQVIGTCKREWCYIAQLMEAPPEVAPQIFGGVLPFYGADVQLASDQTLEARLWWRVDADDVRPSADYSIGLQLLDNNGALIAQSDGAINHYGTELVQTSTMQTGRIYIDQRRLTFPADLPQGEYMLVVVVYQAWDGKRLTLPNGADQLVLSLLNLPVHK